MHKKKPNKWAKLGRDIMWIAVLIMALGIIMAIISALSGTAKASMTDCIDATCRITAADGGVGSGCVFEIGQGRVYVLTAAHVAGKDRDGSLRVLASGTPIAAVGRRGDRPIGNRRCGRHYSGGRGIRRRASLRYSHCAAGVCRAGGRHAQFGGVREWHVVHRMEGPCPGL